ncbi:hypothetical protein SGUI_1847 [Serinicoccus hydrothermalis]|uniref:Uncharacterized protein n=1 Tax=Serinicoccus hydrothermalis TaxID=1758689 RepID=A0A1B1NCU2_9MICO|nr:hypothetical protein [Serinicoccus hydrothermalis]ANS79243.1 hypothetical protein SGUI_1847 [Serinicoccus hydrothermalis]
MPAEADLHAADPGQPSGPRITLLGPQRHPQLDQVASSLGLEGARVATITAGWRDREHDDSLLVEQLGGSCVNLGLWQRMQQIWAEDPELEQADRARRAVLTELQELYVIGLQHAVEALTRIRGHEPRDPRIHRMAVEDVLGVMRDLDERHVRRVAELHQEFYARHLPEQRDAVVHGRAEVGRLVEGCDAVVITGGHVGVLLGTLHMFNLAPVLAEPVADPDDPSGLHARVRRPVIAWGAGAMALTERVMLFYDDAVIAPGVAEMLMDGLGLTRGLVALPSASDRLAVGDPPRMQTLVSRCHPRLPLPLDPGDRVDLTPAGRVPEAARVFGPQGSAVRYRAAGAGEASPADPRPGEERS